MALNVEDFLDNIYNDKLIDKDNIENNNDNNDKNNTPPNLNICSECGKEEIIEKEGNYICMNCGIKFNKIIDSSQEWRYYGENDNKSSDPARCGLPINELYAGSSMGTTMCSFSKCNSKLKDFYKKSWWNLSNYMDITFNKNAKDMEIIAKSNGMNNCIIEEAKYKYKKIMFYKFKKKAKKEAIQAACIQYACKINNVPRDSNEMALMFNLSKQDMRKGTKQFKEIISIIEEENSEENYINLNPDNSINFLKRRCSQLKISNEIYELCKEVCIYIEDNNHLIKHIPLSRTAGCVFFTTEFLNLSINKSDITNVCSISEVTINKCYQKLLKIKDDIITNTSLINYK